MKIQFSRWDKWCSIRKRPAVIPNTPGVYIIAEKADPTTVPDPISENVIYIGQSMKLRARLQAFDRTCEGKRGHAGGRTLRASRFNKNPPGSQWESLRNDLSIAFWRPDYDTSPSVPEAAIVSPGESDKGFEVGMDTFRRGKTPARICLEKQPESGMQRGRHQAHSWVIARTFPPFLLSFRIRCSHLHQSADNRSAMPYGGIGTDVRLGPIL